MAQDVGANKAPCLLVVGEGLDSYWELNSKKWVYLLWLIPEETNAGPERNSL